MPVQQAVDVAVPLETAYNQWTQFEEWPNFMHRVTNVTQEDDCTVSFSTKIWTRKREFTAKIETQRPDQRIKWKVSQGIEHTGVVTFHEIAPRLTRIELTFDVAPGGMIEKAARGMRNIKRAARADLHRYKAFIEMQEIETGAWRGVIEDGELVEPHPEEYDEERDYSEIEDAYDDDSESDSDSGDEERDEDEQEEKRPRTGRFQRQSKDGGDREESRTAASSRSSSSREASGDSKQSKPRSSNGNGDRKSGGNGSQRRRSTNGSSSGRAKASSRS
jgi:cobalamin biosynthesis protein CobT